MESQESLAAFLAWLGRDNASAARKYEEVRQKLILLFRLRGCPDADQLADETIDRTARAVLKPGFTYAGDPVAYFRGVGRNIYFEWLRRERAFCTESISDEHPELPAHIDPAAENEEVKANCLERCLELLPATKKQLLLRYYRGDKGAKIDGRQQLAEEEGIGLNSLRIQLFRLRNTVRQCVESCLTVKEMKPPKKTIY